jgi:hypothetical protein
MAAQARRSIVSWQEQAFDMRSLRRLAIWGGTATTALVMAVVAGYSGNASRQSMAGASAVGAPSATGAPSVQKSDARTARLDAHPAEMEPDTQRLADAVRVLAADRDQLVARIGTLERNLEDITGTIKRQDFRPESRQEPRPESTAAAAAPPAPPSGSPAAVAASQPQPSTPERVASAPAVTAGEAPAVMEAGRGEFGVDIGGAANFEGLRTLWASAKASNGVQFEGLHPAVAVRENGRSKGAELRLIVGPLADVEAAVRLCATLSGARRYCQPVAFEGQRLADADTPPERKPAAAPRPAPKPATKPPSKPVAATSFRRPF